MPVPKPIDLGRQVAPPPPPTSAEIAKLMPPPPPPPRPIDLGKPVPPPAPPTSADIAKVTPVDPDAWPTAAADQVRRVQALLRDMRFYDKSPDGRMGPATRAAIREYEGLAGLKVTGQANKELFDSLKEMQLLMKPKGSSN